MLTVAVGFDWSGNKTTRSPFARRCSVRPSTLVTSSTPLGSGVLLCWPDEPAVFADVTFAAGLTTPAGRGNATQASARPSITDTDSFVNVVFLFILNL